CARPSGSRPWFAYW
nr:immunoglobulin heavy chain junction region [Mus musculus]